MLNLDELRLQKQRPDWVVSQLRIKGGELAKIRFLTDYPEIRAAGFHTFPTFNTSLGFNIYRNIYCVQQDNEPCKYCESQTPLIWQWHAWVWVYDVLRSVASQVAIEPVTIGEKVFYKEKINAVRLLRRGPGRNFYIIASFKTYFNKYGTLCDRDYEWSRQGSRRDDTTFALIPEDKSDALSEIQEAAKKVLPIEEYIKKAYSPDISFPQEGSSERLMNKLEQSTEAPPEDIGDKL